MTAGCFRRIGLALLLTGAGAADGGNADGRPGVAVGEGFGAFRPFRPEAFAAWAVLIRRGRRGRSQIRQAVRVL